MHLHRSERQLYALVRPCMLEAVQTHHTPITHRVLHMMKCPVQPQRTVVLAEPVYPADSPARSNHSMSRAGSTSGDLGVQGAPEQPSPEACCGLVTFNARDSLSADVAPEVESLDHLYPFRACWLGCFNCQSIMQEPPSARTPPAQPPQQAHRMSSRLVTRASQTQPPGRRQPLQWRPARVLGLPGQHPLEARGGQALGCPPAPQSRLRAASWTR